MSRSFRLHVGTTNRDKVRELAALLASTGVELVPTDPIDPEETAPDLAGNAVLKARAYAAHSGGVTLAEDSGIVVPALRGLPGAWSARFSECRIDWEAGRVLGHERSGLPRAELDARNNALLLERLRGVEQPRRAAAFQVVLAVATAAGEVLFLGQGESHGWIAEAPRGANGFGYDPVFVGGDTFGKTYAELDNMRKNLRSHRRRVTQELMAWLGGYLKASGPGATT